MMSMQAGGCIPYLVIAGIIMLIIVLIAGGFAIGAAM